MAAAANDRCATRAYSAARAATGGESELWLRSSRSDCDVRFERLGRSVVWRQLASVTALEGSDAQRGVHCQRVPHQAGKDALACFKGGLDWHS